MLSFINLFLLVFTCIQLVFTCKYTTYSLVCIPILVPPWNLPSNRINSIRFLKLAKLLAITTLPPPYHIGLHFRSISTIFVHRFCPFGSKSLVV